MLACFCLTAQAAVKEYAKFTIDVPDDWTETKFQEHGADFTAPDKSCTIGVAVFPKGEQSLEAMAKTIADHYKGTIEKDADGDFFVEYKKDGKDGHGALMQDGDFVISISILGEHPKAETIINSVKPK